MGILRRSREAVLSPGRGGPQFNGHTSKAVVRAGGQARPLAFPDAVVDVAQLLKR
jgi:hypothetical protein